MKKTHILIAIALTLGSWIAQAGPGHHHGSKIEIGPNGGRLINSVDPHAEFFVTADRKIQITFVDDDNKMVPVGGQVVSVVTGDRSAPLKMTFLKTGGILISEQKLPDGSRWPVVVQIKGKPESQPIMEKFTLNLAICSGCKKAEYVCTCAHTH